ncbi:type I restriction-modification system subunit M [Caproiciproducens faecalis]|uniref:site-specific DNA-methyltransferase (adenine-specific) n=1 Tax=Caproiciproducens faecalis TaxID=2820301 RepID=A0ABS7DMS8_9FIRM|nr:type I restriction-modification system subunit M [Caproiciproducens faecalis]MBW7571861.1 type I restriction-modification system subunit M [Caproiciproducens faecalis]
MNKQQLASKIWESANRMRSKIEANEYKDYILGFIFYKFLSDEEIGVLRKDGWTDEDLKKLVESDDESVGYCQSRLGYFISYENLFTTWLKKGKDFSVANVRDALSAFSRLISDSHKKVFNKIFDTLQTGLSKLGDSAGSQTKAISDLLQLIKDIPMDGKQDYDVLGFIYEYLISNFAANAGKKAGEFYTPHEVSLLMSEIVANHLKGREKIEIYDPTSGSGSLLITIGKSVAKYIENKKNIKYYAQEWKENTYNLTRMNLVMRGIIPDNIVVRCGDTLEDDWPLFDDADPARTYTPLYVDAVVSNPPYSQHWDPSNKDTDPRYKRYGMAPKSKADYAFLLHDLYHIKPDGIMTIVLPHGVLFRGSEEGKIRKNLIENNNIEAIIGLPANIFFGTGIPTIIMVLRQKRPDSDVLFIDASKGFIKAGKNNKLQASDIKKIVDTIEGKKTIDKYSRLVTKKTIRENDYNLNIPRYVDSSDVAESWDIYATMFGGIPNAEIELLKDYWTAFPQLRNVLFQNDGTPYSSLAVSDVKKAISDSSDVKDFIRTFETAFNDFDGYLDSELIEKMQELNITQEEAAISENIFGRIAAIPLIDKYKAYQLLDDEWSKISTDLEIIQTEGFASTKQVDPNMVIKKKDGKDEEVQDGWIGHVIPFELVQTTLLKEQSAEVKAKEKRLEDITAEYTEIIESFSEEEKVGDFLNDDNDAFVPAEVRKKLKEIYEDADSPELSGLYGYLSLIDKKENKSAKLQYIAEHTEVDWSAIEGSGVYAKGKVTARIKALQEGYTFPEDSFEAKLVQAVSLMDEEKDLKKEAKELAAALHLLTKKTIENLSDEQALELLWLKWISPLSASLHAMPVSIINDLVHSIQALVEKYAVTGLDLETQIKESEASLSAMIDDLQGSEYDRKGLSEFQSLLKGE